MRTPTFCITREFGEQLLHLQDQHLMGIKKGDASIAMTKISIAPGSENLTEVDHFFPWKLKKDGVILNVDGIWNLVLSCQECNAGEGGKFARLPSAFLLTRLHKRNNYLIDSHHPLRETLMRQTGSTTNDRKDFLEQEYNLAIHSLIHTWEPSPKAPATF